MQNIIQTLQRPTSPNGEDKSTYYPGAFLANPFPLQDGERERKTTATSGRRCYALYGKSGPLGSLEKTLLESLQWYSPARKLKWVAQPLFSEKVMQIRKYAAGTSSKPSAGILNEKDIPSGRLLFRLVPSEHRTEGTGCGLLPTVQTQGLKRCNAEGKTEFIPLELLPTPKATRVHKSLRKRHCPTGRIRDIQSNPRNNKMNYYGKFSTSPVRYRIGEEDNKW